MKSRWSDTDLAAMIKTYAEKGVAHDLAERVYTTRLLGSDPKLVLHGGGNTSVKTHMTDLLGDTVEVICIKGSGWDMGNIEPAGIIGPGHEIATDSKGNIYIAQTGAGMQKLTYKGMSH